MGEREKVICDQTSEQEILAQSSLPRKFLNTRGENT
jgi:hypothetical protein